MNNWKRKKQNKTTKLSLIIFPKLTSKLVNKLLCSLAMRSAGSSQLMSMLLNSDLARYPCCLLEIFPGLC